MSRLAITYDPLVPSEVPELQVAGALYSTDFRATGEALDFDIPAMWKYENLAPWLCANAHSKYLVNEGSRDLNYNGVRRRSQLLCINKGGHASESIYSRFNKSLVGEFDIQSLWVGVPHPDADSLARELNIPINYKYGSFLTLNDKISQKKLIPSHLTPDWAELHSAQDVPSGADGYVKNRIGAGGFGITRVRPGADNGNLGEFKKNTFYFEKFIKGAPSSIQCHKNGKNVTVFGYSTQTITDGQYYTGSIIHDLSDLGVSDRKSLQDIIQALSPLMDSYDGFFGIDFIKADRGVYFLEANIRMTAVTIPTLLFNITDRNTACFTEDADSEASDDVVLTKNSEENARDILRFNASDTSSHGLYLAARLFNVRNLKKHLDRQTRDSINSSINNYVSRVVNEVHHDFWPYGWTYVGVLQDSHFAISSWYKEAEINIDIYSCKDMDTDALLADLSKLFTSEYEIITNERR